MENYFIRNDVNWQAHLFEDKKVSIEAEVLNICCGKGDIWSEDRAIQKSFDCLNLSRRCDLVAEIVDTITNYSEVNTTRFYLCLSYCCNDVTVSNFAT